MTQRWRERWGNALGGGGGGDREGRGQVTDRRHLTNGRGNAEFNSVFPSSAACPVSHPHSSHSPAAVFTQPSSRTAKCCIACNLIFGTLNATHRLLSCRCDVSAQRLEANETVAILFQYYIFIYRFLTQITYFT